MPASQPTRHESPQRAIRRLYHDVWGYEIPSEDERAIRASKGTSMYGEIMPAAVDKLIGHLDLDTRDVFFDLGSGVGKVVLQVAMTAPVRKCVGVELARSRNQQAVKVLRRARAERLLRARACVFRNADLLESDVSDATVVYCCSTAFSLRFMRALTRKLSGLAPGLRLLTTQPLFTFHGFREVDRLLLDMSWKRRSPLYVYRLEKRRA